MGRSRSSTRKASARLRRAIKLGLVKRSDFPNHLDKKSQDRLRRLVAGRHSTANRVERLLDSGQYQKYFPRSHTVSRALDSIAPQQLRGRKIPFKLVPVGKAITKEGIITRKIERIRVKGKRIEIDTHTGERVTHVRFTPAELATNPDAVLREMLKIGEGYDHAMFKVNTTKGFEKRFSHSPGAFPKWVQYELNGYATDTEGGILEWFRGFAVTGTPKKGKTDGKRKRAKNQSNRSRSGKSKSPRPTRKVTRRRDRRA